MNAPLACLLPPVPRLPDRRPCVSGGLAAWLLLLFTLVHGAAFAVPLTNGPNGQVNAVARGADGTTYLGGYFTTWGQQSGSWAALDLGTGLANPNFPPVTNGAVWAQVPDGSGGWYLGGSFTTVGGMARNHLAQIDSSGAVTAWDPGADSDVLALAFNGSTVYAGGNFTTIGGGASRNYLAALDGSTGAASGWNPNPNARVNALALHGGGKIAAEESKKR